MERHHVQDADLPSQSIVGFYALPSSSGALTWRQLQGFVSLPLTVNLDNANSDRNSGLHTDATESRKSSGQHDETLQPLEVRANGSLTKPAGIQGGAP